METHPGRSSLDEGLALVMTRIGPEAAEAQGRAGSLRLLGPFELHVGGQAVAAGPIESRILALAAIHDDPLSRRRVAATLWPRVAPARAAARLRSAIYRLHRLAPQLLLGAATPRLALSDGVGCDVRDLQRWAHSVIAERADDRAGVPPQSGELLPGWQDPWVLLHRERLRQLQIEALEVLAIRLGGSGRHEQAAAAGRAAVQLAPLRESARRVVIRALAAAGRHRDAAREYDDYRAELRRELSLAPSPHLDKVMAAVGVPPSRGGDAPVTQES